jgi:uncharacterized membrane protein YGL010W
MSTTHRWQFSLRTLLLLAVPLAVVLAVSRLAHARQLWLALAESVGYFGGCGFAGAFIGYFTRRKDGVVDGALIGLLIATLIFFALTLAGW